MPLYNSSEVFVPAKQYGNTIHSPWILKRTERDARASVRREARSLTFSFHTNASTFSG